MSNNISEKENSTIDKNSNNKENLTELMKIDYTYPSANDKDFQYKIYKKREFYYHKIPPRPDVKNYQDIKEYRDNICARNFTLQEHQALLANFINPDTPYRGILIFHGLGSGKTCVAVAIAEKFKSMVQKYNTKIYILVSGPLIKENWRHHLLICTGETYLKYIDKSAYIDENEKQKLRKNALNQALQFYKFMSYRSFYKRVLGEKIVDKKIVKGNKVRVSYRKTEEGDYDRDIAVDRLYNLNNSIIIIDEAHNLTGNAYGDALLKIIRNSVNLRVVLLTATPMKNLADDIVELLNFIRPPTMPMERDKIFNSHKNHFMELKENGLKYLKEMAKGYVSHVRGADPLTFAKRVDKGTKPKELLFTQIVRCAMLQFQQTVYDSAIQDRDDTLDRRSEAVANFVFPGLSPDRKELVGYYGRDGISVVRNQIKSHGEILNKQIAKLLKKDDPVEESEEDSVGPGHGNNTTEIDWVSLSENGRSITGEILDLKYLKYFSVKFWTALRKLNRLVWGHRGPHTAFVYSNLVKVGIELFQEILMRNGYLEFQENASSYIISPSTICYYCGKTYKEHTAANQKSEYMSRLSINDEVLIEPESEDEDDDNENENDNNENDENDDIIEEETDFESMDSDNRQDIEDMDGGNKKAKTPNSDSDIDLLESSADSTLEDSSDDEEDGMDIVDKNNKNAPIPPHKFYPATFISVTGKSSEESQEVIPEDKKRILDAVFSNIENKEGKYIKFVLGSKVMNEGLSLKNVGEVHVLDVYFNLGKIDQVVGRAIRHCSHYKLMNEENKFPIVKVYKYAVVIPNGLSSEEELYRKAELKYQLIKKVERGLKEVAIDCPLNMSGNIFHEEIEQFAKCNEPGEVPCPTICDYTKCSYECDEKKLNAEFYDPERRLYKAITKNNLDYSTFTNSLAKNEIELAKSKIKEMYMIKSVYSLNNIIEYVRKSYDNEKRDLFDDFFVFKALDELIPITENDFNNFKDTILDKYNRTGYIIYVGKYYIFQPFDQNEDVPMHYRTTYDKPIVQKLSLYNYLKNTEEYKEYKGSKKRKLAEPKSILKDDTSVYDFDSTLEYYDSRDEFKYVGIVDKELSRRKSKNPEELKDVFKIRTKRDKHLDKKRSTGLSSMFGAVCSTSKSREYLDKMAREIQIPLDTKESRTNICDKLRDQLLYMEKYGTKDGKIKKLTYCMVPANHPIYPFPYNLEDRVDFIIKKIKNETKLPINATVKQDKKKTGAEKGMPIYTITIKDKLDQFEPFMKTMNAVKTGNTWIINVE
jgi:DNA polymerase III delta prime subunit